MVLFCENLITVLHKKLMKSAVESVDDFWGNGYDGVNKMYI